MPSFQLLTIFVAFFAFGCSFSSSRSLSSSVDQMDDPIDIENLDEREKFQELMELLLMKLNVQFQPDVSIEAANNFEVISGNKGETSSPNVVHDEDTNEVQKRLSDLEITKIVGNNRKEYELSKLNYKIINQLISRYIYGK